MMDSEAAGPRDSDGAMRIGFALLPKKVSRYLTPAIQAAALAGGIELYLIDISKPLSEQGPFNAIIHKLRPNRAWECDLQEYSKLHPDVRVIDRVDGIATLRNRITMLSVLRASDIVLMDPSSSSTVFRVKAPPQVVIPEDMPADEAEQLMLESGMRPPLIVKPVWTDGREGSHGLAVVHDMVSLSNLLKGSVLSSVKPPAVIQEFVEHGGVLFKVYVVGNHTAVSKRPSLGDNYLGNGSGEERTGIMQLPRISCKSVSTGLSAQGDSPSGTPTSVRPSSDASLSDMGMATPSPQNQVVELPPEWFTHQLANELRKRLNMHLFNFDLLRVEAAAEDGVTGESLYFVIDINYFPGVDKIPHFEEKFVQFLQAACRSSVST